MIGLIVLGQVRQFRRLARKLRRLVRQPRRLARLFRRHERQLRRLAWQFRRLLRQLRRLARQPRGQHLPRSQSRLLRPQSRRCFQISRKCKTRCLNCCDGVSLLWIRIPLWPVCSLSDHILKAVSFWTSWGLSLTWSLLAPLWPGNVTKHGLAKCWPFLIALELHSSCDGQRWHCGFAIMCNQFVLNCTSRQSRYW